MRIVKTRLSSRWSKSDVSESVTIHITRKSSCVNERGIPPNWGVKEVPHPRSRSRWGVIPSQVQVQTGGIPHPRSRPHPWLGYPRPDLAGLPPSGPGWVPHHLDLVRVPHHLDLAGVPPIWTWPGYPIWTWLGYPIWTCPGYPLSRPSQGTPHLDLAGVPPCLDLARVPPSGPGWGTPHLDLAGVNPSPVDRQTNTYQNITFPSYYICGR